ncbi:hypothetical protein HG263_19050 [Pseudoalteromonas sp. JBTF-M23]|uniref:Uncharacterized protein n=1 Tax=Pseudoalteromonas caenipelagi TaxID=2726988 RepID=A0A849VH52_9GAMM|nr:hypothetical protein [Pseudoalteromonas caenipelagi]NOU52605.1 hypothetical protein [Pseudoalteromonas caenipelagi]
MESKNNFKDENVEVLNIQSEYFRQKKTNINKRSSIEFLSVLPKCIVIGKPVRQSELVYECVNTHETARLLFGSLCLLFFHVAENSDEYAKFKLDHIADRFPKFTEYINQHETTDSNQYQIIKSFETYLVEKGLSNQSVHSVFYFIKEATKLDVLGLEQVEKIKAICSATKLIPIETEQYPLDKWFTEITWLRGVMSAKGKSSVYKRLASPKLLMKSFNLVVSEIMFFLQKVSRDFTDTLKSNGFNPEQLSIFDKMKSPACRNANKLRVLLSSISKGQQKMLPEHIDLLIFDWISESVREKVNARLRNENELIKRNSEKEGGDLWFNKGVIFDEKFLEQLFDHLKDNQAPYPVTKAEEICFYWLNCAQTVQASDALTLKYSDFVFHGSSSRITHFSCDYYKSRAHDFKFTDSIDASSHNGKAMLNFLMNRKDSESLLSLNRNNVDRASSSWKGVLGRTLQIAFLPFVENSIRQEIKHSKCSTLFLDLIQCLQTWETMKSTSWVKKQKEKGLPHDMEAYRKATRYWAPNQWFTGSMIKTAAVHSDSLNFRVGTLVNYNSHTPETEQSDYLSSNNQEHTNTVGRMMRLVMEDIETVAYRPNHEEIESRLKERQARTELISGTTGKLESLNLSNQEEHDSQVILNDSQGDVILVVESTETVVEFLHYLEQAKTHYSLLANRNPDFLEKHVLPTSEWMDDLLTYRFSKDIKTKGYEAYENYKSMLPPLFFSQLGA